MKAKAYIKHLAALLMFGTNGVVASYIALSSYETVFTRTLLGSLFIAAVFAFSRQKVRLFENKKNAALMAVSGAAMGLSWMFLYEAYSQMGVGIATLAYYCGPVIVMILSPVVFRESFTWAKVLGFLAVMAGMLCINIQALNEGKTAWGVFCGAMSAIMYVLMLISYKKTGGGNGLEKSMWQLVFAFVTLAVYIGAKQGFAISVSPESWIPIIILGVINTGVGCYFYFTSVINLPVQSVAVCGYIEPLAAVVFSVMFLGESMGIIQIIGAALILGGAAFGELYGLRGRSAHYR